MKDLSLAEAPKEQRGDETSARRGARNPLVWLNLVCLDAPLVAVSWLWLFSRTFSIPIASGGTAALFLTAWFIYLADRFGDSLSIDAKPPTSLRQRFCQTHRTAWIATLIFAIMADAFVVFTWVPRGTIWRGAVVGMLALGYLMLNQLRPSLWRRMPLKEICIGVLFAAGTMIPLRHGLTSGGWIGWSLFAALCSLNCVSIAVWERELDRAQGRVSIATEFAAVRVCAPIALVVLAAVGLVRFDWVGAVVGASAILLAGLHFFRGRFDPDVRTALADLVLLTPLLAWAAAVFF